ncbi:protein anachronism isoform X1 [Drosophila sechellia]|uniref:protein anachronism isoform X1 n=1 Tax=Drosophila sechellia TaxID=7238 RepID=UPI0013DE21AD|nr:protein anachronism isoform X1 [Drosophila sechellia]
MASAMRGEKCERSRMRELVLILSLIIMAGDSRATPFDPSFFIEGVQSEVVNPFNRTILNRFNLTEEQILSIQNRSNPNMRDDSGQSSNQQYLQQVATQRLNDIFKRVQKAISNEPNGSASKEKAGFPICNAETTNPEQWSLGNNVTLQFASSVFISNNDDRLSSALLRLYKTNPGQTREHNPGQASAQPISTENPGNTAPNCAEQPPVGPQIRVTVSIVHQQRKKRKLERKKRTCNTAMLSSSSTGWVEIDVKCALAYWEQQHRQQLRQQQPLQPQLTASVVGILMIEVHDDEENLLRPGLYFAPPTCDQADIAVPWSVYRTESFKSHLASWTLPRKPRLDIFFNGSNSMKSSYNTPKSRAFIESTTSNSPTIDNQLDESGDYDSQQRAHIQLVHQRRHHHNYQQPESESAQLEAEIEAEELMSSASNSEQQMEPISNHHRHRTGHHHPHHQLHQHHHHHHRHTKHHRISAHKQE